MCERLQEAAEGKLWLLAMLSCTLEPFGVKVVYSRLSRTGLTREAGPFGSEDFSGRYLSYVENESCRFLEYYGFGNKKFSLCVYMSVRSYIFTVEVFVSELVAVNSHSNEHREMNASERTMASCASTLCYVSLVVAFLRSYAGGR